MYSLRLPRQTLLKKYALVIPALLFIALHIVLFRDLIPAIPELLAGDQVIVRDELVPFFDVKTQFLDQLQGGESALTYTDEVRVSYSFWTAWVRYAPILPLALIFLNSLSAYLLFLSIYLITRHFGYNRGWTMYGSFLAALLVHFLLLFTKITHFYSLIIGFGLFALSISLFVEQLFLHSKFSLNKFVLTTGLILLNPAIHFHILAYLLMVILLLSFTLLTVFDKRLTSWMELKTAYLYTAALALISGIPYAMFILAVTSNVNVSVSNLIPIDYWTINFNSTPLSFIYSLVSTSQVDMFWHGDYISPQPRYWLISTLMLIFAFVATVDRWNFSRQRRYLIWGMTVALLISMWLAIGYAEPWSFHQLLLHFYHWLAGLNTMITNLITQAIFGFINILRFPHRFLFIQQYALGVLLALALLYLMRYFIEVKHKPKLAFITTTAIVLLPLVGTADYRNVLVSGNFNQFIVPYQVEGDLTEIRRILDQTSTDKLFITPSLESGRELKKDGQRFSFIDKFLIYYFNQPTFYYGTGADVTNKLQAYWVYDLIESGEPGWERLLQNNIGATHILHIKQTSPAKGLTHVPGIEQAISGSLENSSALRRVYEGTDYDLYAFNNPKDFSGNTLIDSTWEGAQQALISPLTNESQLYLPVQTTAFLESDGPKNVFTDDIKKSFYDIYLASNPNQNFYPPTSNLPFSNTIVSSALYTSNLFSMFELHNPDSIYNYTKQKIPGPSNLRTPRFTGTTSSEASINVEVSAADAAEYRLLIRGATLENSINILIDGKSVALTKSNNTNQPDYIEFEYFEADLHLTTGSHTINIPGQDNSTQLIESIGLIPTSSVPDFNAQTLTSDNFDLVQSSNDQLYDFVGK